MSNKPHCRLLIWQNLVFEKIRSFGGLIFLFGLFLLSSPLYALTDSKEKPKICLISFLPEDEIQEFHRAFDERFLDFSQLPLVDLFSDPRSIRYCLENSEYSGVMILSHSIEISPQISSLVQLEKQHDYQKKIKYIQDFYFPKSLRPSGLQEKHLYIAACEKRSLQINYPRLMNLSQYLDLQFSENVTDQSGNNVSYLTVHALDLLEKLIQNIIQKKP